LWILYHEPEKVPQPDAVAQYRFDQGYLVGELARSMFPRGIDIPAEDFMGNIRQTKELVRSRITLFEAGFLAGNTCCRLDILNPAGNREWDIIEVKSSTKVKDVNIHDVSFQKFCCENWGLIIRKCFLLYINNDYVKNGEIDPGGLFNIEDITDRVDEAGSKIRSRIDAMHEVITAEQCPDVRIGRQCNDPYGCPLVPVCWDFLPENNVFNLYRGGKKCLELFEGGVLAIKDIPDDFGLSVIQQIQRDCEISGKLHVNKEAIDDFLQALHYPLYYLDFETFSPAVPMFDGTRPYQRIPFQFSLHMVKDAGSSPEHFYFLAEGSNDPRPEFLCRLKEVLGDNGSIVVYNQAFEEGIVKELADAFPEYSQWTEGVAGRMVDLLLPFKGFHYYHPEQRGSASLKRVLPAVTGVGYEEMDIDSGEIASIAFMEATYNIDVTDERRDKIRDDLLRYCKQDTEGMVWIVDKLRRV